MSQARAVRINPIAILVTLAIAFSCTSSTVLAQEASTMPEATQEKPELPTPLEPALSAADAEEQLRTELQRLREKHTLPALWAGKFYVDGRAIVGASGVRKWQSDSLAQASDAIHIGSCTKAMTAVMIAQLCSKGSLSFETKLSEIFPNEEVLVASAWGRVTVDDLLQHRSGAPANADWQKLDADHPQDVVAARRAMLEWLVQRSRPEKARFVYSNVGYVLLGHIVETIEGQAWESLIATKLFDPLEMKSAGLGPLDKSDENGNPTNAWGHTAPAGFSALLSGIFGKAKVPKFESIQIDNPPPLGPAGRAHMNLADWSKFVLQFASDQGCEKIDIKPEIWSRLLKTDGTGDYAGGWILIEREWAGGRALFHNGSNTTWYCVAFVAPGKGYCLLAATNTYSAAARKACDQAVAAANELGF